MVTLKQVAAEAGVSTSTASAALRGLDIVRPATARKIVEVANRLDYHINVPARALRSGRTGIYTLIVPDIENQYYAKLANSLAYELLSGGKRLIIQVSQYDKDKELQQIRELNPSLCDGLFIVSNHSTGREVREVAGSNRSVLMFDDMSAATDACYDSIETPAQAGMYAMIHHLVEECGRRRVGIVGTYHESDEVRPALAVALRQDRYDFAYHALESYGLAGDDAFIASDWGFQAGVEVAHRIVGERLQYDALCCMNDELALGVMRGLAECGVNVPDDVAVTGFDGILGGAFVTPTLTTVAVDFAGMAQTAMHMMENQIARRENGEDDTLPRRTIIGFQLLKRESTLGRTASTGFTTAHGAPTA